MPRNCRIDVILLRCILVISVQLLKLNDACFASDGPLLVEVSRERLPGIVMMSCCSREHQYQNIEQPSKDRYHKPWPCSQSVWCVSWGITRVRTWSLCPAASGFLADRLSELFFCRFPLRCSLLPSWAFSLLLSIVLLRTGQRTWRMFPRKTGQQVN